MEQSYEFVMGNLAKEAADAIEAAGTARNSRERDMQAVTLAVGRLKFECLCRTVRAQHATPWNRLEGIEAARFRALQRFSWTPDYVRTLSRDDLMFALQDELRELQLPAEAVHAATSWVNTYGLAIEFKGHLERPD
jgi:hypothetical protein